MITERMRALGSEATYWWLHERAAAAERIGRNRVYAAHRANGYDASLARPEPLLRLAGRLYGLRNALGRSLPHLAGPAGFLP